jgi:hypothetical protein
MKKVVLFYDSLLWSGVSEEEALKETINTYSNEHWLDIVRTIVHYDLKR